MKKVILTVLAVFVAVMFVSVAVAATSTSCGSCAKSTCNKCTKTSSCNTCAKPCNVFKAVADKVNDVISPCNKCAKPSCNKCVKPCNTCAKPCVTEQMYKRNVLGQKIPVETAMSGDAMTDTATKYEAGLITGKE